MDDLKTYGTLDQFFVDNFKHLEYYADCRFNSYQLGMSSEDVVQEAYVKMSLSNSFTDFSLNSVRDPELYLYKSSGVVINNIIRDAHRKYVTHQSKLALMLPVIAHSRPDDCSDIIDSLSDEELVVLYRTVDNSVKDTYTALGISKHRFYEIKSALQEKLRNEF